MKKGKKVAKPVEEEDHEPEFNENTLSCIEMLV
jgi:hypothetical protein